VRTLLSDRPAPSGSPRRILPQQARHQSCADLTALTPTSRSAFAGARCGCQCSPCAQVCSELCDGSRTVVGAADAYVLGLAHQFAPGVEAGKPCLFVLAHTRGIVIGRVVTVGTISTAGCVPPRLHRDWTRLRHICSKTGLAPATSAPGLAAQLEDDTISNCSDTSGRVCACPDQTDHTAQCLWCGAWLRCGAAQQRSAAFCACGLPLPLPLRYHSMPLPALPIMPANSPKARREPTGAVLQRVKRMDSR
jgi:hypothetical protein